MSVLCSRWSRAAGALRRVEVYLTADIVSFAPGDSCYALINSANEQLSGPKFSPTEANRRLLGNGLIYPEQVVDGRVHEFSGKALRHEIERLPEIEPGVRCKLGSAVRTPATGELRHNFAYVIHTVAPFYKRDEWDEGQLRSCYWEAFNNVWGSKRKSDPGDTVATPILAAGAKGVPITLAARVAAQACTDWSLPDADESQQRHWTVRFALQDDAHVDILEDELKRCEWASRDV
mmetsp:Transcript_39232/g.85335  ORF Transcript_39232/g.85335 Transcript_39232/m.85335 type:complete len:234 (-) Transcript_39232:73-774(-)|eukprot:CAMPEP_0118932744 /NCGR_PEP_ID=MMETSP1169-20130426/10597_1 /TAXON_ID=36882 /ORGANISM="Pyramimonas obovata, Strain CCMP722" /LENGTH=233 /DNA_ID=CAMNT_0006875441 /DNA_START=337 /DNA_END=1038 /DNA_ORIENTATION=+